MKTANSRADIFVPDEKLSPEAALARTTHLCIAAHQDDIEIMAYHGAAECFGREDKWFSGVVVTNGAGSPRAGLYKDYTDDDMQRLRLREQRKAAYVGDYSIQFQLAHPSSVVKNPNDADVQADLSMILNGCHPEVVYLHQPADKHDTHVAVLMHSLKALRALPAEQRPRKVYGCEVWRDLDWLCDADKQLLDVGQLPNIAAALMGVFDSQITGGKRYDLAITGRRLSNATFYASHETDAVQAINWAMDLTPLVQDETLSIHDYTLAYVDHLRQDISERLKRFS